MCLDTRGRHDERDPREGSKPGKDGRAPKTKKGNLLGGDETVVPF